MATARARGVDALERCVFGPVPAAGRWRTVLLLDGNIGIGGDPASLLRRAGDLLGPGGVLVKLWVVFPKLFERPPVRSVAHALERGWS